MATNNVSDDGYTGQADETTGAEEFNSLSFLINQVLSGKWTITLCVVKNVSGGGVSTPATVSVQPMVNQVDGYGNPTPHGIINNVPAFRLQGGSSAFIFDPMAGDIGLLACASRDISAVKNNLAPSNPGSLREFDPADGLYLGGFLNAEPTQYIQITADGINIVAPSVKINGVEFGTHVHSGVQTGGGDSGPPVA
jgi:hypothetical protein